jgi:peptidoglycan/xylan/chitin deacetylase (PgdA/CDA1 family)
MAVAFDAGTNGNGATSFSHTVGAGGTNRYLIVGVGYNGSQAVVPSGITYAGVAMTLLHRSALSGVLTSESWGLVAPATGANNVVTTWSGAQPGTAEGAASFTGVDQSVPTDGNAQDWADQITRTAIARGALQKPPEFSSFLRYLSELPPLTTVVEIGTAQGGTFGALCTMAADDALMTHERWSDLPDRSLVLTFDDGHVGNAELLDLFVRYGVRPTVYLCSQVIDTNRHFWFMDVDDPPRFMPLANGQRVAALQEAGFSPIEDHEDRQALNAADIERMRDVVDFAAHTRFHPILPACSEVEARDEIATSRVEIEQKVGEQCLDFSYPNGDYGEREIELVKESGYRSARTVDLGWNSASANPFLLRCLGTSDDASVNRLAGDLSGVSGWVARLKVGSLTGRHRPAMRSGRRKAATLHMITFVSIFLYEAPALVPFP